MRTIYNVRRPSGKICAQCLTRAHANREIKWQIASGFPGPFVIEPIEREPLTRWGYGAPKRGGFKWAAAKHLEFLKRYMRGDLIKDMREYFECSEFVICGKARELGFNKRIDDPRTFEKHRGRWTDREEELVNFMYDEIGDVKSITDNHPRGPGAVESRLRLTAPELSTRSRFGRFIAKKGSGHRTINPAMADTGGYIMDGDKSGKEG